MNMAGIFERSVFQQSRPFSHDKSPDIWVKHVLTQAPEFINVQPLNFCMAQSPESPNGRRT